jgi:hypothetical protein
MRFFPDFRRSLIAILFFGGGLAVECRAGLGPVALTCEFHSDPLGVDEATPRLGWQFAPVTERNLRQTAFQILVSSSQTALERGEGDFWDSGRVESAASTLVAYAGVALRSSQACYWKVRVWDHNGKVSAWSPLARWTMGLLAPADWQAKWIGAPAATASAPAPATLLLRREFTAKPKLVRALVHVTGVGQYELTINGRKVSEDLLSPGWTNYRKTVLYDTFDVTTRVRAGAANAIGLILGNGMYNVTGGRYVKFTGSFGPIKAIAQLRLDYSDGTSEFIGTDAHWQAAPGPITFSCVFGGEDYDARLEPTGWNQPGFKSSGWVTAQETTGPGGELRGLSHAAPPIRAFDVLKPVATKAVRSGVTVYDLGQNASLMPRFTVQGASGSTVRIIPAELINADGSVDRVSVGGGEAYWQYTLAGAAGGENWFPKFFYHGARYLQVECSAPAQDSELPVVKTIEGVVVHTASPPAGDFETSNELFNRIRTLIRWAQRSNLVSLITDCPHRERLGWLEQYHLNGPSLRYEFDLTALFAKCFDDLADAQLDNGLVPDIAPEYVVFSDGFRDSPEWGSAFILAAWQQYLFTGDTTAFQRHYDGMKRYVAYLTTKSKDHLLNHGLGDWADLGPKPGYSYAQLTPVMLTATAIYYEDILTMGRIAVLLNRTEDIAAYNELGRQVRAAFNQALYKPEAGSYATGSQTSNAMPCVLGLVERSEAPAVLDAIVADVRAQGGVTAGDVGYRYLLRALADGGRSDVIYAMNNQSGKPGYGYQLERGATSLTESWSAVRGASQNHFMLGQIMEWFYHDLAGIQPDPEAPGFRKIIIKPAIVGDLTWVKGRYDSAHGRISSAWKHEAGRVTLSVGIPGNTTATIYLPADDATTVTESNHPIPAVKDIRIVRVEKSCVVLEVGSGTYEFSAAFLGAESVGSAAPVVPSASRGD